MSVRSRRAREGDSSWLLKRYVASGAVLSLQGTAMLLRDVVANLLEQILEALDVFLSFEALIEDLRVGGGNEWYGSWSGVLIGGDSA